MLPAQIYDALVDIVGSAYLRTEASQLVPYSFDATPLFQHLPDAVVFPGSTDEIARILRLCAQTNTKIVPRGNGSGLSGGAVPIEGGIVLEMNRLNQLDEIDTANLTATFGPGLVTSQLSRAVEAQGLFYPPDPGSVVISSLGGNVAECAGGMRGLKYGVTKDYVLGLEAVLPNGEVIRTGGKNTKDVAGYDLNKLLIGSEGTLAVITEITVKLLPKPAAKQTAMALFDTLSQAAAAVAAIIAGRILPATLEFLDQPTLTVVEAYTHAGLPTDVAALLLIEQDGAAIVVKEEMERIAVICRQQGAREVRLARDAQEGEAIMNARRATLPALSRLRPTTILEDATVPRAQLATMVERINAIAAHYGVMISTFGHAGDGNLHPTALTDARNPEEIEAVEQAFDEIFRTALQLGGTITGEHGVGLAKAAYMEARFGKAAIEVMKGIKRAFDPQGILNPGKMFAAQTPRRVVVNRDS